MPGGDRTGPMGMGPGTGRGMGYCGGHATPGYANAGFGRGRGRGFGRMYYTAGMPDSAQYADYTNETMPENTQNAEPEMDEKEALQNQIGLLETQLKSVRKRLKELEKEE